MMKSKLTCLHLAALSVLFALFACQLPRVQGAVIESRADLLAQLGPAAVTEDFEAYKFPTNTAERVGTNLDATSVINGQGPGLVRNGVRFTAPDAGAPDLGGLQWDRQFQYGLTSAAMVTDGRLIVNFTISVNYVGFDMFWFNTGYPPANPATVQVFAADDVTMIYSTNIFEPFAPDLYFFGFTDSRGIGRIVLFRDEGEDSLGVSPIIDNLTFGFVLPDTNPPTMNITSPTSGQRWSNSVFAVTGTARDNVAVSNVWYQLNGGGWTNASSANGWTNWTTTVTLLPGTNTLKAYAADTTGHLSTTNSVSMDYVVTNQLQVQMTGRGTLSPNYSNAWLEIGRNYSITSTPASGFVFTNWVVSTNWIGGTTTTKTNLQFMMASNLTLQATFVDVTRPTNTITAPTAGQRWSNLMFTVTGTAKDNAAVSTVWYQLNGSVWTNASSTNGWTNWTTAVSLLPGTNIVQAYAVDTSTNQSTTNSVSFQFVVTNQLRIRASGLGTISPNYSNAWLEIGRNYSTTATAATNGFVFTNWVVSTNWIGGTTTTKTNLPFMMASNLTLQVNFADVTKPTLAITAPASGQHMTNALATVVGTARDNWKISNVWYQLNGGVWGQPATTNGWTNWTMTLELVIGTNTIKAYALDWGGNYSTTNSRSVVSSNTFKLQLGFATTQPLASNGLSFSLQVSSNLNGHIQVSTNLLNWAMLTNFVGTNTTINFCDPAATNFNRRFYRAVVP